MGAMEEEGLCDKVVEVGMLSDGVMTLVVVLKGMC